MDTLAKLLMNAQAYKRATKLRQETDPQAVAEMLEGILKQSVAFQASGNRAIQKKSLEELKQIRADLVAGNINAGGRNLQITGLYSHLIDQMDQSEKETVKSAEGSFSSGVDAITKSIPSADSLISALTVANPLLGYGVKMIRDITQARNDQVARDKEEAQKRIKILEEQQRYIEDQLRNGQEETAPPRPAPAPPTVSPDFVGPMPQPQNNQTGDSPAPTIIIDNIDEKQGANQFDFLKDVLDDIRKELTRLREFITSGALNDPVIAQQEITRIEAERIADEKIKADKKLADERIRQEQLDRLAASDTTNSPVPLPDGPQPGPGEEKKGGLIGMIEGIMGALRMLIGGAGLGAIGAAVMGLLSFVTGPVAIIVGVLTALYKFLDGFFNAEEIIDKATKDISIKDRILAGIANLFSFVANAMDWVAELFGYDLIDNKNLTKDIYKTLDNFTNKISKFFTDIFDFMFGWIDQFQKDFSLDKSFGDLAATAVSYLAAFHARALGALASLVGFDMGDLSDIQSKIRDAIMSVPDKVMSSVTSLVDTINGYFEDIVGKFKSKFEELTKPVSDMYQSAKEGVSKAADSLTDNPITRFLGFAPEEQAVGEDKDRKMAEEIKNTYGTEKVLFIGGGVGAVMDSPGAAPAAATQSINRAEAQASAPSNNQLQVNQMNAPVNNNQVNNNTFAGGASTSNRDSTFRNGSR